MTDFRGMLQENGLLAIVAISLVPILGTLLFRGGHKLIGPTTITRQVKFGFVASAWI
jgi:hypothetical protein